MHSNSTRKIQNYPQRCAWGKLFRLIREGKVRWAVPRRRRNNMPEIRAGQIWKYHDQETRAVIIAVHEDLKLVMYQNTESQVMMVNSIELFSDLYRLEKGWTMI